MKIKAGHISNLTDARYFASKNAHWLGLNLNPSDPDAIDKEHAKGIMQWIAGCEFIGEMGKRKEEEIFFLCESLELNGIQIDSDLELSMYPPGVSIFRHKIFHCNGKIMHIPEPVSYLILDIAHPEKIQLPEATQKLNTYLERYNVLLNISNATDLSICKTFGIKGVNIRGGKEIRTGVKAFTDLSEIMEKLSQIHD